jgi:DNA repair exonuclease SbcCD ATPase subunit
VLIAVLLALPACNRTDSSRVRAGSEERATTEQLKTQRDAYVKQVDAKLAEFDQKFDGLEARAKALTGAAKTDFDNSIKDLRDERKQVAKKLDDLKAVSVESWTTLKGEVDAALANLERSYERVSSSYEKVPSAAPGTKRFS